MTGKMSKKGRNPGVVDNWLDNLDLYRKNVAYDETCLFRAVSEQLFDCQVFHERVRKECIDYGRTHYDEFKHLLENENDWKRHINMLEKHMVICGNLEINMISRKYERDVLIFHANQQQIYDVTKHGLPSKPIMLCLMDEDHYDAVYKKEHITDAGFCQSIVYKILYEDVFKISNVDNIVNAMLYEKSHVINQVELEEKKLSGDAPELKAEDLVNAVIAPFPFKVAKALDPAIYRNIEYDSWGEVRRELRLGDWYYGDDKLKLGTRCILNDLNSGEVFECYIQELLKNQEKCVVYLTKFAEKRIVDYSDLAPENDAKPWPLPYRFSKNLVISNTTQLPPIEKTKHIKKKNKEKRHSKSFSEVPNGGNESVDNVSAYVGVPLQMHNNNNEVSKVEVSTDTIGLTVSQADGLVAPVTPDINQYPQRFHWEQVHWPTPVHYLPPPESTYYPQTPDPFTWPQSPTTPNFDYKPMVASASTPNVPYNDTSYPYYFNYHVAPYPQYPLTPTTPNPVLSQNPQGTPERNEETFQHMMMMQCQQSPCEEAPVHTPVPNSPGLRQNITYVSQTSHSMEMYPPVLPLPAGNSVLYTTSPVAMYTPTTPGVIQLVPPPAGYLYSPGQNVPTVPWFNNGFADNSQGFIFPQSHQAK